MTKIICTETNDIHEYEDTTYDAMCMYDAITFKRPDQSATIATIATEEDAEWWHEYERVNEECEEAADEMDLDVSDVAYELGLDFSDLGEDMDKVAKWLGVRQMFATEA